MGRVERSRRCYSACGPPTCLLTYCRRSVSSPSRSWPVMRRHVTPHTPIHSWHSGPSSTTRLRHAAPPRAARHLGRTTVRNPPPPTLLAIADLFLPARLSAYV